MHLAGQSDALDLVCPEVVRHAFDDLADSGPPDSRVGLGPPRSGGEHLVRRFTLGDEMPVLAEQGDLEPAGAQVDPQVAGRSGHVGLSGRSSGWP